LLFDITLANFDNVTVEEDYNPCTKQIAQKDEKNGLIKMFYTNEYFEISK